MAKDIKIAIINMYHKFKKVNYEHDEGRNRKKKI